MHIPREYGATLMAIGVVGYMLFVVLCVGVVLVYMMINL